MSRKIVKKDGDYGIGVPISSSTTGVNQGSATGPQTNVVQTPPSRSAMSWPAPDFWYSQGQEAVKKVIIEYLSTIKALSEEQDGEKRAGYVGQLNELVFSLIQGVGLATEALEQMNIKERSGDVAVVYQQRVVEDVVKRMLKHVWGHNQLADKQTFIGLEIKLLDSQVVARLNRVSSVGASDLGVQFDPTTENANLLWQPQYNQTNEQISSPGTPSVSPPSPGAEQPPPEALPPAEQAAPAHLVVETPPAAPTFPGDQGQQTSTPAGEATPAAQEATDMTQQQVQQPVPTPTQTPTPAPASAVPQTPPAQQAAPVPEPAPPVPEQPVAPAPAVSPTGMTAEELKALEIELKTREMAVLQREKDVAQREMALSNTNSQPINDTTVDTQTDGAQVEPVPEDTPEGDMDEEEEGEDEDMRFCPLCDDYVTEEDIASCDNPECPFATSEPSESPETDSETSDGEGSESKETPPEGEGSPEASGEGETATEEPKAKEPPDKEEKGFVIDEKALELLDAIPDNLLEDRFEDIETKGSPEQTNTDGDNFTIEDLESVGKEVISSELDPIRKRVDHL